ncbi:MAG: ABC transporter ATP-binding protein [Oscillospiraceae bacterium]|nr:ABC transporter ATP-binding protein [Oscillospiraceae bacterium]MBQ3050002.1 ABC transporter ATP-binding protein [Oscillospiraceae bacterium]MBQ9938627.1 ABC transporter ATP-binding protein [Oscillospiraceae bacterium]
MESILYTENLTRKFKNGSNTVTALNNVSVQIEPGKLTMLRGRSGSGKTTLINLLGALDYPTEGKIFFQGEEISKWSERKRDKLRRKKIGFIFQSVALISTMTAYENVEFELRLAGYPADKRRARAKECLEIVGLGKRMHHRPIELSGGEQQRVAIARAISHKPQIIFADEPTAELDSIMGLQIIKLFKELVEKEQITIVMTTHDPSMIEVADKVYTLEDGVVTDE